MTSHCPPRPIRLTPGLSSICRACGAGLTRKRCSWSEFHCATADRVTPMPAKCQDKTKPELRGLATDFGGAADKSGVPISPRIDHGHNGGVRAQIFLATART